MSVYDYYTLYLKPMDLKGQSHLVKIARVDEGLFYNQQERKQEKKLVIGFENRRKCFILNSTQASAIMDIAGTDDEHKWQGVEFVITPGRAKNGKDTIVVTSRAGNDNVDIAFPRPSAARPSTALRSAQDVRHAQDAKPVNKKVEAKITKALNALEKKGLPNAAPVTWWVARDERAVAWAAGIWGVTSNVALLRIDDALSKEQVSESLPEQEFKEWVDAVKVR